MEVSQIADNKYLRYFCYLVMIELFLMGSGQELHVAGFLTLRMVNFIVAVGISMFFVLRSGDIPKTILWFLLSFTITLLFAVMIAAIVGTDLSLVVEDVKPLIYFYILLYYYYMCSSEEVIRKAYGILLLAGKIMTVLYLIYILLTDITGIISYVVAYQALESDSFMFRGIGSAIFYKSFIFLPIAAVGYFRERKYIWLILSIMAIYFTYTRGLYLLLVAGLLIYYLRTRHVDIVKIAAIILVGVLIYEVIEVFELFSFDESFKENREDSDYTRVLIIQQVSDAITWWSVFIGHGFGFGIGERTTHMEISYVDIFHKQGIIGLTFWGLLLVAVLFYGKSVSGNNKDTADFWVTAALMIYLQSCFNPYINTPMGMTVIILAFVICLRLSGYEHFVDSSRIQC